MIKHDVFPLQRWVLDGHIHPQQCLSSLLPHARPQQHSSTPRLLHTPRHHHAPSGLLFGTMLGIRPWLPAHPPSLHTSPVISTLSPSTTKLQLPQPVIISTAHTISRTRGRVPLESGLLNKRGLLLFHHRGLRRAAPELLMPTPRAMGMCVMERGSGEGMQEEEH